MWSLRWHFTNKTSENAFTLLLTGHLSSLFATNTTSCHIAEHYGEEYDDWNSAILRSRRNCSSDGAERTDDGRAFHAWAAVTEHGASCGHRTLPDNTDSGCGDDVMNGLSELASFTARCRCRQASDRPVMSIPPALSCCCCCCCCCGSLCVQGKRRAEPVICSPPWTSAAWLR